MTVLGDIFTLPPFFTRNSTPPSVSSTLPPVTFISPVSAPRTIPEFPFT